MMPQTQNKRGSGRRKKRDSLLYGSDDPAKNVALTCVRQLAPDEKYSWGCRDGLKSVLLSSMAEDPHYNAGWDFGYALRQTMNAA